jgi:hypothetical protein
VRTDYPLAIAEDDAVLRREERRVRGRPTAVRVRALRLLKGGAARTLGACADLVGHSPRQVARWWATYRREGLPGLLREPTHPGRAARLTPAARGDLEAAIANGQRFRRRRLTARMKQARSIWPMWWVRTTPSVPSRSRRQVGMRCC